MDQRTIGTFGLARWCARGLLMAGTITSFLIRRTEAAQPSAAISWGDFGISAPIRKLLWEDKPLLLAVIVSSTFYIVAGVVMPTVNSLGKGQLKIESDTLTSILAGGLAIGIILGAVACERCVEER